MSDMTISNGLIILATLLGPVLAVQAQKWIEILRERKSRKAWVFQTLMATRAARLSPEHVKALNMIDLTFYGTRKLGISRRTKREQVVIDSWREYLDHLNTDFDEASLPLWASRGQELLVNLLHAIAADVDFSFDRVQLRKGVYSPVAHDRIEREQEQIRQLACAVLSGEQPLKMDVSSFAVNEEAMAEQLNLQRAVREALSGERSLSVTVRSNEADI